MFGTFGSPVSQSPKKKTVASGQWMQLSQATLQFHLERKLHLQAPIVRFEPQGNERRVYED